MVVLGVGLPLITPTSGDYTFTDVPPAHPFFAVIETAALADIVTGYTCGTPAEPCDPESRPYLRPYVWTTRGQLSKMLVQASGWDLVTPATPSFADVSTENTFYPFVETAFCRGVISGYACGEPGEPCDSLNRPYFRPTRDSTRGQFAKILYLARTAAPECVPPSVTPTVSVTPTGTRRPAIG